MHALVLCFECVLNHPEQHHIDTFTQLYTLFYMQSICMENESNQQKPSINEIYVSFFFFPNEINGVCADAFGRDRITVQTNNMPN